MHSKIVFCLTTFLTIFCQPIWASGPSFERLYVANEGSDTITVIDPKSRSIIAHVPTGPHPHNVNVDPLGRYFYATNYKGDAVQVFDVKTNGLVTTIPAGPQPAHVVPDRMGNTLYVSNEGGTTLSIISVQEFKSVESLELGGHGPHGLVLSPDGRTLLTPNSRSGDVSLIDLAQRKPHLIKLPSGAKPVAMGVSSDGKFAFVTDAGLNQVHKIDVVKKVVLASLSIGKRPIQIPVHPTRSFVYIPCMEDGALYKVNIEKWRVEKVIPVGKGAHGIAYSSDGRYAYITLTWEEPSGKVAIVDTEKDKILTTILVQDAPNGIALLTGKNQGW